MVDKHLVTGSAPLIRPSDAFVRHSRAAAITPTGAALFRQAATIARLSMISAIFAVVNIPWFDQVIQVRLTEAALGNLAKQPSPRLSNP
jgi:hypothetical protein